jgi:hypothetical protein
MPIRDEKIRNLISEIGERYRIMRGNKFMQAYLNEINLKRSDFSDIEDLIQANDYYEVEGYDLEKLYDQIYTYAQVLQTIEKEMLPRMRNESQLRLSRLSDDDKIRFKMTAASAEENHEIERKLLAELFENVKRVDLAVNGQNSMVIFTREHFKELDGMMLD